MKIGTVQFHVISYGCIISVYFNEEIPNHCQKSIVVLSCLRKFAKPASDLLLIPEHVYSEILNFKQI